MSNDIVGANPTFLTNYKGEHMTLPEKLEYLHDGFERLLKPYVEVRKNGIKEDLINMQSVFEEIREPLVELRKGLDEWEKGL